MEERIQRLEDEGAITARQLEEQRSVIRDRIAQVDKKIAEVQKKLDELNAALGAFFDPARFQPRSLSCGPQAPLSALDVVVSRESFL